MPACVLYCDQGALFFLTCSLRGGHGSEATVLLSEQLLRSFESREDFDNGRRQCSSLCFAVTQKDLARHKVYPGACSVSLLQDFLGCSGGILVRC